MVSQELLRKHLTSCGVSSEEVDRMLKSTGHSANGSVPYAALVEWLFPEVSRSPPGAGMAPAELSAVPADARREVVLQTLALLIAAACWTLHGKENGRTRVQHSANTPDAFVQISVAAAEGCSAEKLNALCSAVAQQVKAMIGTAYITLEVLPVEQAVDLLQGQGSQEDAALVASLAGNCKTVGLHAVNTPTGTFRTAAVATVTAPSALSAIPWQIRAAAAGQLQLLGPTSDLQALSPGTLGRLGPPRADAGAADCNEAANSCKQTEVALHAEAMHENSLAEVSAQIAALAKDKSCVVVVAGPSSSGKTTFSCRLAFHIKARGIEARPLECDMYYKARADPTHPRDAKGELNFEVPDALRLDRIKQDLAALTAGRAVELPKFSFKDGTIQENTGHIMQLPARSVLIVEGIFGLHPKFLTAFENVALFKVLIGPWSGARLSSLHVVPERKLRLLRRIGRDVRSRGVDAARVMHKFTSVSVGERANIFPHAGSADIIFDSALHYELPALKAVIGRDVEAASSSDDAVLSRRTELSNYLSWVESWPESSYSLLPTSIACEFLGNSIFE
eukprot:TRINITY_DN77061_c0_g1_i1.p1 TRINITY_DN77061_c0_g1~~TRINITY_DN77061_c0_g1_i1.p1  ORF type:complete len:606 (+),score=137.02 TRINITY_DN77061_c0_g1_i1:126-1820(+)